MNLGIQNSWELLKQKLHSDKFSQQETSQNKLRKGEIYSERIGGEYLFHLGED